MRFKEIQTAYTDKLNKAYEQSQRELRAVRNRMNAKLAQDATDQHNRYVEDLMASYNEQDIKEADAVDLAQQRLDRLKKQKDQEQIRKKRAEIQKKQKQIKNLQK